MNTKAENFELENDKFLMLLNQLYGIFESGDLWYQTFSNQCKNDLKLNTMRSDPSLCYFKEKTLRGPVAHMSIICYQCVTIFSRNEWSLQNRCSKWQKMKILHENSVDSLLIMTTSFFGSNTIAISL